MSGKFKSSLKNIFSYVVHGESTADFERKPGVVDDLVKKFPAAGSDAPGDDAYADRLRPVLMDTATKDLETLRDRNVTICLDTRLRDQENGFWDQQILGVFHNDVAKGAVVALWDSGKTDEHRGFFGQSAESYGSQMLEKLAEKLRNGEITGKDSKLYAGSFAVGKSTYVDWRKAENFDEDSIRKNPGLQTPPVLKPPVAKPSAPQGFSL